ncbi:MAG TPA: transposase [Myxococcaceae bacterium]|nr:transposase [Myxococcaceae bacterium]
MAEERTPPRPRRSFTDEFKASAVQRVLEGGKTVPQVARDLDLTESPLRGWVEQARADTGRGKPEALTSSEREELTRLRKEVRELRTDREISRKPGRVRKGSGVVQLSTESDAVQRLDAPHGIYAAHGAAATKPLRQQWTTRAGKGI